MLERFHQSENTEHGGRTGNGPRIEHRCARPGSIFVCRPQQDEVRDFGIAYPRVIRYDGRCSDRNEARWGTPEFECRSPSLPHLSVQEGLAKVPTRTEQIYTQQFLDRPAAESFRGTFAEKFVDERRNVPNGKRTIKADECPTN